MIVSSVPVRVAFEVTGDCVLCSGTGGGEIIGE